jgi:hypothetical protein
MSRFGFVTPNGPPRAPGPPKPRKTSRGTLPGPRKMPRKIAKGPRPIFQNWKAWSRIKRILNKLGCKRETSERHSNPLDPESMSSLASQEIALRHLLIFRYRWATQRTAAGIALNFWVSGHTQKSTLSLQHPRISFRCGALPRIFRYPIEICMWAYYLIPVYFV